jgi:hypothetical protein
VCPVVTGQQSLLSTILPLFIGARLLLLLLSRVEKKLRESKPIT